MKEKVDYDIYEQRVEHFKIALLTGLTSGIIVAISMITFQGIEVKFKFINFFLGGILLMVLLCISLFVIDKYLQCKNL